MKRLIAISLLMPLVLFSAGWAYKNWRTYENCTLRDNDFNDGDSFHVKYKGRHYLYRLCFVDTPESDDTFGGRVKEQAEYFGISEKDSTHLGKQAAKFTRKFLKNGFTGYSRMKDARGQSKVKRHYAMVEVDGKYLSMALVENGLARIFGITDETPDGVSERNYTARLKRAERKAQEQRIGGWKDMSDTSRIDEIRQKAVEQASASRKTPATESVDSVSSATVRKRSTPKPKTVGTEMATALPEVEEQTIILMRSINVYSLKDMARQVGILKAGAEVKVLGAESATMVRIRFEASPGKMYEAQCRRFDLGI